MQRQFAEINVKVHLKVEELCSKWWFITSAELFMWEMDSENPEDFDPALTLAEDDRQEIRGLINSDGEEVDFSDLSEQMKA